jgi:septal ring factor EnvC (AmiA/AmiB activator)
VELRAQAQHRLVGGGGIMLSLLFAAHIAVAQDAQEKILDTRATISEAERKQRESLSALFTINKKIKQIAKKRNELNNKMLERESKVRIAAQELQDLEAKSEGHKGMLNKRLRQLYQERNRDNIHWLFSAKSPVELERNHRFLKRMIDSDHKQIKGYIARLSEMRAKRNQLKSLVAGLAQMKKEVDAQEGELTAEMRQKSRHVTELKKIKASKLNELKDLRAVEDAKDLSFAFFERKGTLKAPVEAPLAREYGTFVDAQFRFRLMHKGLFYATKPGSPVNAVFEGVVALAGDLPGYGKTVIVDHGDNYYSVYAFAKQIKVKRGSKVREGDVVAVSGGNSPLFGPGLYFEIRHFTDAIDPRSWIKDSLLKTVQLEEKSWDVVSGTAGQ